MFIKFNSGEDLNNKARNQYQAEQLREWALEQQREREQAQRNQEKADRLYELKMRELDQRSMDLQRAEEECRKSINLAQADYNKALVRSWQSACLYYAFLKGRKHRINHYMKQLMKFWYLPQMPDLQISVRNQRLIFLFLNQNLCCGYSMRRFF